MKTGILFVEYLRTGIILNFLSSCFCIENGFIELFGGHVTGTGHVKVYNNGVWGAVCDDGWSLGSAQIVCKVLGYKSALGHTVQSWFGESNIEIMLDDVQCYGDEKSLLDCKSGGWGFSDCTSRELAGVFCSSPTESQSNSDSSDQSFDDLQNTFESNSNINSQSQPNSDPSNQSFDDSQNTFESNSNINSQSTQSDTPLNISQTVTSAQTIIPHAPPIVPVSNSSNSLEDQLQFGMNFNNNINPPQIDGVSNVSQSQVLKPMSPFDIQLLEPNDAALKPEAIKKIEDLMNGAHLIRKKIHKPEDYRIRLINGRGINEGRVEVSVDGHWYIICSDHWTLFEANVVCQQAKQGYAIMAVKTNSFGGENMKKIFGGIICDGNEKQLSECYHGQVEDITCEANSNVAGVVCSPVLPDLVTNTTMLQKSAYLEDRPIGYMECAMEEGCASESAYVIQSTYRDYNAYRRRLLRFSSSVWNFGTADFRPFTPKHLWEWHSCHLHYHSMRVFAHYDILDFNGNKVAQGHKASFCLEDVECLEGVPKRYRCADYGNQGISVGCADNYLHDIDCQWVDVTDVNPGKYIFRVTLNPDYLVAELDFTNNISECELEFTGFFIYLENCILGEFPSRKSIKNTNV